MTIFPIDEEHKYSIYGGPEDGLEGLEDRDVRHIEARCDLDYSIRDSTEFE